MDEWIKLMVVGDGGVGKTCLLITYTENRFPQYFPKIFGGYSEQVKIAEEIHTLYFFDSAGHEEYDRLRPLAYPNTDIFLVCFSVCDPPSFENVQEKWVPEIKHN